jgi:hypothetical protein
MCRLFPTHDSFGPRLGADRRPVSIEALIQTIRDQKYDLRLNKMDFSVEENERCCKTHQERRADFQNKFDAYRRSLNLRRQARREVSEGLVHHRSFHR